MAQDKLKSFQIDVGTNAGQLPVLDNSGQLASTVMPSSFTISGATFFNDDITLGSTKNINVSGGGTISGLPATPVGNLDAASKVYVDNIVTSGTKWQDPITDPSLVGVATADPGAVGSSLTYIAYGGSYPQTWGTITDVAQYDILTRNLGNTDWIRINVLSTGARFLVAAESSAPIASFYTAGFRKGDLIEYVSGDPGLVASWAFVSDGGYQVIAFNVAKLSGTATGLNTGLTYDLNVTINGTLYNVTVTGVSIATFGGLATTLNTSVNAAYVGASCVLEAEGHFHIYSGDLTKVIVKEGTGANPLLAGLAAHTPTVLAGIVDGTTVIDNDPQSLHLGHTYNYSQQGNLWVEIAGPSSIVAGAGLSYSGNTLNITAMSSSRIAITADHIDLATTGVSAASYGTSSAVGAFVVDAYGRLTSASNTSIQIAESQVTNLVAALAAKATDSSVVHLSGTETITGAKTFSTATTHTIVNLGTGGVNGYFSSSGVFGPAVGDLVVSSGNGSGNLSFAVNNIEKMKMHSDGGLSMTGATGASQGAGTINATGLYVNGVAITNAFSGALVYHSTSQNISTGVTTSINFNTEQYDIGGWHDNVTNNHRFTIPSGVSVVRLTAKITFFANSTGDRQVSFYKNNSVSFLGNGTITMQAPTSTCSIVVTTAVLQVSPGDFFHVVVNQTSGSTLGVFGIDSGLGASSWFCIEKIS